MSSGEWRLSTGDPSPQEQAGAVVPAPLTSAAQPGEKLKWANKTVLLVDSNAHSREARRKAMRTMGVRVECVATADAARAYLKAGTYNLVLVDLGKDVEGAESLVNGIRSANSRQLVAFLIGSPLFIATSLSAKSRPRRLREVTTVPTVAASPRTTASADFGQRVRDVEAKQAL